MHAQVHRQHYLQARRLGSGFGRSDAGLLAITQVRRLLGRGSVAVFLAEAARDWAHLSRACRTKARPKGTVFVRLVRCWPVLLVSVEQPAAAAEHSQNVGLTDKLPYRSRVITQMDLQHAGSSAEATRGVAMPGIAVKKEPTASALVYSCSPDGWQLCLIMHPRLGKLLPAGGHVELDETTAEAAVREVLEETGLQVRLVSPSAVPLPSGTPHVPVPAPWWILEMQVPADRHEAIPHVHVDSIYVAIADEPASAPAAHEVVWLTAAELAEHPDVVDDTRVLAKEVFAMIESLRD